MRRHRPVERSLNLGRLLVVNTHRAVGRAVMPARFLRSKNIGSPETNAFSSPSAALSSSPISVTALTSFPSVVVSWNRCPNSSRGT